jgi:hypothetical protein
VTFAAPERCVYVKEGIKSEGEMPLGAGIRRKAAGRSTVTGGSVRANNLTG